MVFSHWGIKPEWMTRVGKKDGLINVRFETLRDKRTFQADLAARRCLIPADGFYEWKGAAGTRKVPFRITRKDGKLRAYEVSRDVNRASVDTPELIEPVAEDFALRSG